jgi:hypothetical protein
VRVWISYTPTSGEQRNAGYYGLHFPATCNQLVVPPSKTHAICSS